MRDINLILKNEHMATAETVTSAKLNLDKTPIDGTWIELKVTAHAIDTAEDDETLGLGVFGADDLLDTNLVVLTWDSFTKASFATSETVIKYHHVVTNKKVIYAQYTVGGTDPDYTVEVSILSGPPLDARLQ